MEGPSVDLLSGGPDALPIWLHDLTGISPVRGRVLSCSAFADSDHEASLGRHRSDSTGRVRDFLQMVTSYWQSDVYSLWASDDGNARKDGILV